MPRYWHVLKGNLKCETAHNVIFFDTETTPTKQPDGSERDHLWFGWMLVLQRTSDGKWGSDRWYRFSRIGDFWKRINQHSAPKRRWFIFCHNTSFDLPIVDIFGRPQRYGWTLETAVIEAPPTIITFKSDQGTLTFLDTLNWWRIPLATLGDRVGLPKLDMPGHDASRAEWDLYCRRDVEVLRRTVLRWFDFLTANDLGGFAPTLAGQAFRTYRHRFMSHPIVIDDDGESSAIAREGYHGGRVECFRLGRVDGPVTAFDVNSMFPAVMRDEAYPCKLLSRYPTQHPSRWMDLVERYCIVARVTIHARDPCYPVRLKEGLSFPRGQFETTLNTPELARALARDEVVSMRDIVVYEKAKLFEEFVSYMYEQRQRATQAGDGIGNWLFKILMNSLYGKFGQTGQVYETMQKIQDTSSAKFTIIDAQTRAVYKCRQLGGLLQVMRAEGEARDSFPAISGHVTSYARLLLWDLIKTAGERNVIYCDTDSLYVVGRGAQRLRRYVDPVRLGALKRVGEWAWMTIHGLKDYELPGQTIRKGIRKDAREISPGVFEQVRWSSLKGLVGEGDTTAPGRRVIIKRLKREYKKPSRV